MSALNKLISYFPSIRESTQGIDVNLLTILNSDKHKETILQIRQADQAVQKQLKESLPCFTVAGTFSRRCDEGLITPSGLAAVDLDSAEAYDTSYLLRELKKIPSIAYAGLSCRGKRLFCIVPFKYPDKYLKHYERLIQSFKDMGLPMGDDCHKRISQPRFISWNDEHTRFFNHDAKPYHLLAPERTYHVIMKQYKNAGTGPDNVFQWCVDQVNKSYSFNGGARHDYLLHLIRYCNMKGLPESEALASSLQFIQEDFTEKEIRAIVSHIYNTQADSHAKYPFQNKTLTPHPRTTNSSANYTKAYVNEAGKLFIPTPLSDTYTVRQSIEHYNNRSGSIEFVKKAVVDISSMKVVFIKNTILKVVDN